MQKIEKARGRCRPTIYMEGDYDVVADLALQLEARAQGLSCS